MEDQLTTPERGRQRDILTGAQVLSGQLGKTIQRLRKAYNLSLSELAEQSGVAKSIISQIERNETNPTLATIWRLSQALDVSIERVLATGDEEPFIEKSSRADTPILVSDDGTGTVLPRVIRTACSWCASRKRASPKCLALPLSLPTWSWRMAAQRRTSGCC